MRDHPSRGFSYPLTGEIEAIHPGQGIKPVTCHYRGQWITRNGMVYDFTNRMRFKTQKKLDSKANLRIESTQMPCYRSAPSFGWDYELNEGRSCYGVNHQASAKIKHDLLRICLPLKKSKTTGLSGCLKI